MPGGLATAAIALVCGRLLNGKTPLVDARILIYVGVALFVVAMWRLGHLTTAAGEADARMPLIIRGLGARLSLHADQQRGLRAISKPSEAQQASGLINLSRQLGGSFGIAIITTYLDHQVALHRAELVANTYSTNPNSSQRQQAAVAALMAHGYNAIQAQAGRDGASSTSRHPPSDDVQLQRRLDAAAGDIRGDFSGRADPSASAKRRPGAAAMH